MAEQRRAFKGVFIPADIWLNESLSLQEKAVLAEIDSFCSYHESCYASNEHFAKFIGVSTRRIKDIIKSLEDKKLIERELVYKKGSKEIEKRLLRVPYPSCRKLPQGGEENCPTPSEENCPENIPSMNIPINSNNIYGQNAKKTHFKKCKEFVPPTLEEVETHVTAKGFSFNPKEFIDYYEATDWHMNNGKKVSNWKRCCVTWESNAKRYEGTKKVSNGTAPSGVRVNAKWGDYDG